MSTPLSSVMVFLAVHHLCLPLLSLFAHYQQLHRATPGLGIQELVRSLCNINNASILFSEMEQSIHYVNQVPY